VDAGIALDEDARVTRTTGQKHEPERQDERDEP
jgi:hypothetical protein